MAEIKSYSKPPVLVHQVMTGVFVMLGHKEKEMKVGKRHGTMQLWGHIHKDSKTHFLLQK